MSRDQQRGTWRTIRRLEKSIPQVRWYRAELVMMSLFVNIFALGLPIFILQVYDRVLPNLGLTTMQFLVIGLIAVMLLDFFLKIARAAVTTYTGARFEHLARVSAVDHILRTPQDVYENDTPGAYLDKVNAIGVVKDFYSSQLGTLMIDLPFAVFFLGMIWFLGGIMVAVPLVLLTLFGIMAIIVGGNLRRAVDNRSQVDNRRYDFLIEIINGVHTVKAQAFKNLLQRRFDPMQEMSARAVRSVAMQSSIAQSLGSTFGQLNMACVIGIGAVLVIDGAMSAGELAACTLLSGRAMQPLQSAMGLWTNFQSIRVACENAVSVLELPAEDVSHLPEMPAIRGNLELRDVTFGYEDMEEPLIKNLTLNIKAGEMIGIDGDNSSGRSTLLKLMIGLIRPNSGAVMLDGQDLVQHQSQSYRKQMAFLTADSDVYSGTILDNMTYFRGGRYIGRAIKIARQLGLDEEIKRLPEGYGTHVGDGAGGVLPAGFIQRITVIRAMIDNPKVVLFDNANHGLDSNSDRTLMEYINSLRGKCTVVLVTSRPSWLRMSDRRFVMSSGVLQLNPENDDQPRLSKPNPALPAPTASPEAAPQAKTAALPVEQPRTETKSEVATSAAPNASARPVPTATPRPKEMRNDVAAPKQNTEQAPQQKQAPSPQARATSTPQRPPASVPSPKAQPAKAAVPQPSRPAPQAKPAPETRAASAQPAKAAAPQPSRPAPQAKPAPETRAAPAQPTKAAVPQPSRSAPQAKPAPETRAAPAQPAKAAAPQPSRPASRAKPTQAAKAAAPQPSRPAPQTRTAPQAASARPKPAQSNPAPKTSRQANAQNKPTAPTARPQSSARQQQEKRKDQSTSVKSNRTAAFKAVPTRNKPAPKPAATLRAAPNVSSSAKPRGGTIKPQAPKPNRTATFQPANGDVK